jgi:hypothetical protein
MATPAPPHTVSQVPAVIAVFDCIRELGLIKIRKGGEVEIAVLMLSPLIRDASNSTELYLSPLQALQLVGQFVKAAMDANLHVEAVPYILSESINVGNGFRAIGEGYFFNGLSKTGDGVMRTACILATAPMHETASLGLLKQFLSCPRVLEELRDFPLWGPDSGPYNGYNNLADTLTFHENLYVSTQYIWRHTPDTRWMNRDFDAKMKWLWLSPECPVKFTELTAKKWSFGVSRGAHTKACTENDGSIHPRGVHAAGAVAGAGLAVGRYVPGRDSGLYRRQLRGCGEGRASRRPD